MEALTDFAEITTSELETSITRSVMTEKHDGETSMPTGHRNRDQMSVHQTQGCREEPWQALVHKSALTVGK